MQTKLDHSQVYKDQRHLCLFYTAFCRDDKPKLKHIQRQLAALRGEVPKGFVPYDHA